MHTVDEIVILFSYNWSRILEQEIKQQGAPPPPPPPPPPGPAKPRPPLASSVFGTPLTASSPCNTLVCAKCIIMRLTTSASKWCQCCRLEKPMSPSQVKCAPELILLLLSDVMAHCVASTFEVDLPTRSEMHMAVDVAVLLADECLLQVPTCGTVRFVNYSFFS